MITLPKAQQGEELEHRELHRPALWLENIGSGLGSCVIHMIVLVILALIPWGGQGIGGIGHEVLIGQLPEIQLSSDFDDQLDPESADAAQAMEESLESPIEEVLPPGAMEAEESLMELPVNISPSGSANDFSSESMSAMRSSSGGEDFDGLIQRLRRDGLDICIVFDSTSSMSGEIDQVKSQIGRISESLFRLVPKTRISIVTYRDETGITRESYAVRGTPLTSDVNIVTNYLNGIQASGGGDIPEAVQLGLEWAVENNQFRGRARKVILLFGDAPPHDYDRAECVRLASDFRGQQGGIVSTVTCRHEVRLEEFVDIAQVGGGEAFLTRDEREIMTQLIVLVFGSRHREKVLEAFEIIGR